VMGDTLRELVRTRSCHLASDGEHGDDLGLRKI